MQCRPWRDQFSSLFWMLFQYCCSFSTACWNTIPISWDLNLPHLDMVIDARTNFGSPIFREICITACWIIWTTRNAVIFDNGQISISNWKGSFKEELGLVCTKANAKRQAPLKVWRDSYLFYFVPFLLGLVALYSSFFL